MKLDCQNCRNFNNCDRVGVGDEEGSGYCQNFEEDE